MTALSLVLTVIIPASLVAALLVAGLSRHKKSAMRELKLVGETGVIEFKLDPEGAVIINGELWRARAKSGNALKARNRVRVVGTQNHLLVVEPMPVTEPGAVATGS